MRFFRPILTTLLLFGATPAVAQSPSRRFRSSGPWPARSTRGTELVRASNAAHRYFSALARIGTHRGSRDNLYRSVRPRRSYYTLAGRMQLIFSTATSGKAYFDYVTDYPTTVSQPTFTGYKQTYTSANGVLTVTFALNFPGCSVAVAGAYRS